MYKKKAMKNVAMPKKVLNKNLAKVKKSKAAGKKMIDKASKSVV